MPDTSNEIIQTLEAIHNDIKAAKETLKSNNVALESNATSTLSTEINKIPTALKESDELINFNNGKTSLYHGVLINKANAINNTLNDNEFIFAPTDDRTYKFPENVFITFNRLPKIPFGLDSYKCKTISNTQVTSFYCGKNNYKALLNAIFRTSIYNHIGYHGYDTEINDVYIDENDAITYDEQNNIFKFRSDFYTPGVNGQVFVGNKPVTKVNTNIFVLSANVNTRYIECNTLKVLVDVIYYIAKGIYEGAITDTSDKIIRDESFRGHTRDKDAYIVVMRNINFEFSTLGGGVNILPKINNVYNNSLGNIQIRVDDTNPENLKKLHDPKVMANVLQLFTVRNLDGTKIYSYKQNKFIDEASFTSLSDEVVYDDIYDLEENLKILNLKMINTPPVTIDTNLIMPNFEYKKIKQDLSDNINETNGMIANINSKGLYLFKNYNDKYKLNLFTFDTGIVSNALYKIKDKLVKIKNTSYRVQDSLPLVYLTSRGSGMLQSKYDFKGIEIYNQVYNYGEGYDDTTGIGLLLASPYQTKFLTEDSNIIESIITDKAAITYNENIKTIKFKENSIAYTLLGIDPNPYLLTNLYNSDNTTLKLDPPTSPMKFIFTNTTKLKNINKFTGKRVNGQLVLGAYTTSELAKFYDKFINILVPEDYPYLDSFDFAKYRLPVYNLDQTKKYNYSKKAWESITELTPDSMSFAELYPDKAYYYTECNDIKDASFR